MTLQHCIHPQEIPHQEAEGEELHWTEVAEEQQLLETVAAAAGPFAGSIGSKRRNSDSHHTQRTDRSHSTGRTAHCNLLGFHSHLQLQASRMGFRTMGLVGGYIRHIPRRRNSDLHAVHIHRSYAAVGSP